MPAQERVSLFERAKRIAEGYGLHVHVCGCMNPDISQERCFLAGEGHVDGAGSTQMTLFREMGE